METNKKYSILQFLFCNFPIPLPFYCNNKLYILSKVENSLLLQYLYWKIHRSIVFLMDGIISHLPERTYVSSRRNNMTSGVLYGLYRHVQRKPQPLVGV